MTIGVVIPFKQVRPGDTLDPIQEWAKQFEGATRIDSDIVDFFVDNTDEVTVPHSLGRDIFGAIVLGVKDDFTTTGKGFGYTTRIDRLTETSFTVQFDKTISGTVRFWVF